MTALHELLFALDEIWEEYDKDKTGKLDRDKFKELATKFFSEMELGELTEEDY
jgi:hypothetical protein